MKWEKLEKLRDISEDVVRKLFAHAYASTVFSGGLGVAFGGVFVAGGGAFDDIQSVRRVSAAEYFCAANGVCGARYACVGVVSVV